MARAARGVEDLRDHHRAESKSFLDEVIMKRSLDEVIRHCRCRPTKKTYNDTEFARAAVRFSTEWHMLEDA
eukprot:4756744-Pyramimonas_sp.AAC.1